jgi:hypothetical protein
MYILFKNQFNRSVGKNLHLFVSCKIREDDIPPNKLKEISMLGTPTDRLNRL